MIRRISSFLIASVLLSALVWAARITGGGGSGSGGPTSPGGSHPQVQYNNAGSFAGAEILTIPTTSQVSFNNISSTTFSSVTSLTFGNDVDVISSSATKFMLPNSQSPPTADCDNDAERGRIYIDTDAATGQQVYVCEGGSGWVAQGGGNAILNQNTLQSGATFYVASGTVQGLFTVVNSDTLYPGIDVQTPMSTSAFPFLSLSNTSSRATGNRSTMSFKALARGPGFDFQEDMGIIRSEVVDSDFTEVASRLDFNVASGGSSGSGTTPTFSLVGGNGVNEKARMEFYNGTEFRYHDSDNSHYVAFKSSAVITSSNTYVWMPSSGTSGQAIVTDGNNNLSFSSVGGSSVYNATSTAGFPFGFTVSTATVENAIRITGFFVNTIKENSQGNLALIPNTSAGTQRLVVGDGTASTVQLNFYSSPSSTTFTYTPGNEFMELSGKLAIREKVDILDKKGGELILYELNDDHYISIASSDTLSKNFNFILPNSTGTTGQALTVHATRPTGENTLSFRSVPYALFNSTITAGNGAGVETQIFSSTITANTLLNFGEGLDILAGGTFAATASTDKRIRIKFQSTTVFDSGNLAVTSASDWSLSGKIIRTGSATQKCIFQLNTSFSTLNASADYSTSALTLSNDNPLILTTAGTNANDTVGELWKVTFIP